MAAEHQIKSLGIEMNLAATGDQNGVGVHDQTLHDEGAIALLKFRDSAADAGLLLALGE